jgi:hypothetical protein
MLTFAQAQSLARSWVEIVTNGSCELAEETVRRPYGWVFFYGSKNGELIAGNAPIIVDRVDAEVRTTGTAEPLEYYLAKYEATLPPARLIG